MSLVSGIVGPIVQANAAKKAAKTQARATRQAADITLQTVREAIEAERELFAIAREDLTPFREEGARAIRQLGDLVGHEMLGQPEPAFEFDYTLEDFEADPGYEFRLSEGMKAIERSGSARGLSLSGRQLKDLARFGQGLASEEFGRAYGRERQEAFDEFITGREGRTIQFNRLAALAGLGQTASGTSATLTQQAGTTIAGQQIGAGRTISDLLLQGANARASGYAAQGRATGQAIQNTGQNLTSLAALYYLGGRGGGGGGGSTTITGYRGGY